MFMLPIFKAQKILKPTQTNTNLKEIKNTVSATTTDDLQLTYKVKVT